jgi:hypothetical protein
MVFFPQIIQQLGSAMRYPLSYNEFVRYSELSKKFVKLLIVAKGFIQIPDRNPDKQKTGLAKAE